MNRMSKLHKQDVEEKGLVERVKYEYKFMTRVAI